MAETRRKVGLGSLWPLMALMIFIGAFVMAFARFFPNGIEFSQPIEANVIQEQLPVVEGAATTDLTDIVKDPTSYIGKDIIAIVRVGEVVNDRILWLGNREDYSAEMFGVLAQGIDLKATQLRTYQIIRIYATVRPAKEEEMTAQDLIIGRRIKQVLATEKGYVLIRGIAPLSPEVQLGIELEKPTPEPMDEELELDLGDEPIQPPFSIEQFESELDYSAP